MGVSRELAERVVDGVEYVLESDKEHDGYKFVAQEQEDGTFAFRIAYNSRLDPDGLFKSVFAYGAGKKNFDELSEEDKETYATLDKSFVDRLEAEDAGETREADEAGLPMLSDALFAEIKRVFDRHDLVLDSSMVRQENVAQTFLDRARDSKRPDERDGGGRDSHS